MMDKGTIITLLCLSPLIVWVTSAGVIELWFYGKSRFVEYLIKKERQHDGQE